MQGILTFGTSVIAAAIVSVLSGHFGKNGSRFEVEALKKSTTFTTFPHNRKNNQQ